MQETAGAGQILINQTTYKSAITNATVEEGSEDGLDNLVTSRLGEKQIKGRTQPAVLYEVNPYTVPLHEPKPKPQPQRRKTSPFASGNSSRTGMTDPLSNLPPWVTGKK